MAPEQQCGPARQIGECPCADSDLPRPLLRITLTLIRGNGYGRGHDPRRWTAQWGEVGR